MIPGNILLEISEMKNIIAVITLLTAILCHVQTFGQSDVIKKSLQTYGKWEVIRSLEYTVTGQRDAGGQGKSYKSGERQSYDAIRIYDFENRKMYEKNVNRFPGGYVFNFATVVKDTTAFNYDIDGTRGGKVYNLRGKAIADSRWKVIGNHLAYYKVKELSTTKDSLTIEMADSGYIIGRFDARRTQVGTYFLDAQFFLIRVTSAQNGNRITIEYGDYRNKQDRWSNERVRGYINEALNFEENISLRFNPVIDNSIYELPQDYRPAAVNTPSTPVEIAKDIFLIQYIGGDRNVLFVNMTDYVVVVEAPLSNDVSKSTIAAINRQLPGKPIRYVFVTHYHSDHTGGLRQFIATGATLIMGKETEAYVRELAAQKQNDDLTKVPDAKLNLQFIDGTFRLEDSQHVIDFYTVQNSHCDGMSLAHFPNEKIIYQGDLLSVPLDGTLPKPIEVTREMSQFIQSRGLKYDRVIGHHGHSHITPDMINSVLKQGL